MKALRFLIKADGAEETLLPVLPQILHEYFRIMNEIGNDEVVSALQVIIEQFGDHIEPHAVALIGQLSGAFSQYCSAGEDDDCGLLAVVIPSVEHAAYTKITANCFWYTMCTQV